MAKQNPLTRSKKKKALALAQNGQFEEARKLYQQICEIDRVDADAWFDLGTIYGQFENFEEAYRCLQNAIKLKPNHVSARFNCGVALYRLGRLEEAIQQLEEALRLRPDDPDLHGYLGYLLMSVGRKGEELAHFREQVRLNPGKAEPLVNLGNLLYAEGKAGEALEFLQKAMKADPANPRVYDSLGVVLSQSGEHFEAIKNHRLALQLDPTNYRFQSNLLLALQYSPDSGSAELFAEHCGAAKAYAVALPEELVHANDRDPERRIRVGYVSSDFRLHSVAFFLEPLLVDHDPRQVEIFCYSGVRQPDAMTGRMQGWAHHWRDIAGLPDEQVAAMVSSDGIDILVDLAGYTGGCRMGLFARKPAPVQVSWLGYLDTTGLEAMDYRLTDALVDPAGREEFYVESLARLPGCFLCYKPLPEAPEVAVLPALEKGAVTFGSFNTLPKVNEDVIALWAEVLRAVPRSQLFIKSSALTDHATSERYYGLFEAQGIGRDRVELIGHTATQAEHLELYKRLDIALDTFPYNGATTTCEALWMGVPVLTLAGARNLGRMGVSLLNAVGMQDWIAETPEQYVAIAAKMAADLPRLASLRAGLRERIAVSPLCDGKSFAVKVEAAYREMWRKYCDSH